MTLQEFAVRQRLTALSSEFNELINQLTYEVAFALADTDIPENMFRLYGALQGLKLASQSANMVVTTMMLQDPSDLPEEWRVVVDSDDYEQAISKFSKAVAKLALQSVINETHEGITDIDIYILQGAIRCLKAMAETDSIDEIVLGVCK